MEEWKKMNKKSTLTIILILILSCCLPLSINAQVVGSGSIDSGLVGYWRFDENTGISCSDSSGNSITGTVGGLGTTWGSGRYGSCLNFNGSGKVSTSSALTYFDTSDFSVSVWLKVNDNSANEFIVSTGGGGTVGWAICTYNNGKLASQTETATGGNTILSSGVTPTIGSWVMFTVTFARNSTHYIHSQYVNGSLVNTAYYFHNSSGLADSSKSVKFGVLGNFDALYYDGLIDGVRIYNRILSASEVSTLYNGYYVSVTHDAGSTIVPDDYVNVGVDQSQSFTTAALGGYSSWTQYIDGIAYAPQAVITLSGVQSNRTLYATSQWVGGITPAPTTTNDMAFSTMFIVGLLAFLIVLNIILLGLGSMVVRFLVALFTLVMAGIAITVADIPLAPYFQMFTVVISLLCMFLAAKAKG